MSATNLTALVQRARALDIDVDSLLGQFDSSERALLASRDAERLFTLRNILSRAVRKALSRKNGERPFDDADTEIFLHYLIGAENLLDILHRIRTFYESSRERFQTSFDITPEGTRYLVFSARYPSWEQDREQLLESNLSSTIKMIRLIGWLIGSQLRSITLGIPATPEALDDFFFELLPFPLRWQADTFEITFPVNVLGRPVVRDIDDLRGFFKVFPGKPLDTTSELPLRELIIHIFEHYLETHGTLPSLTICAGMLNISEATLRRKLARENDGEGFSDVRQLFQQRLAKKWLTRGKLDIEHIAEKLGFQDVNAFRRSFKRWTGMSPSLFRQSRADQHP